MSVILVNPITADSLRSAIPDTLWIANFPEAAWYVTYAPLAGTLLSAGIAAFVTHRVTKRTYEQQKKDAILAYETQKKDAADTYDRERRDLIAASEREAYDAASAYARQQRDDQAAYEQQMADKIAAYTKEKSDQLAAQNNAAYNLFLAICDEMQRTRRYVGGLIGVGPGVAVQWFPILTEAKDLLLGRLTELMPREWTPHNVFRFYEILSRISVPHNAGVEIPDVNKSDESKDMISLWHVDPRKGDADPTEMERKQEYRKESMAFAIVHYDPVGSTQNLTEYYLLVIRELQSLGASIGREIPSDFMIPTESDRNAERAIIDKLMKRLSREPRA